RPIRCSALAWRAIEYRLTEGRTERSIERPAQSCSTQTGAATALARIGGSLSLDEMAERCERLDTVADDLGNSQHRHSEDRTKNAPHQIQEHQRQDNQNRMDRKALAEKHRG